MISVLTMRYNPVEFESLVARALDDLPDWVHAQMQNLVILVQAWPTAEQISMSRIGPGKTLLGLYEGIPLTKRSRGYQLIPPDRITLFQGPLERTAPDEVTLQRAVRRTVVHEIAHHFGISDARLNELAF